MNSEKRQGYNKKYYANNKEKILNKLKITEQCPLCSRLVKHHFMVKHQNTDICKRKRENIHFIIALKEEIEQLKNQIKQQDNVIII